MRRFLEGSRPQLQRMRKTSRRTLILEALESRRLLHASTMEMQSDQPTPLNLSASITGTVNGYNVSIDRHDAPGTGISLGGPTWLVAHGNSSSPTTTYIDQLADALHTATGGNQVLTIDWSSIAALPIGTTESNIIPVAQWASTALIDYGFVGGDLNLLGHSFGAYVAAETAERIDNGVDTIVGLDPAADWPFAPYNPNSGGEIDFAAHSMFSWTFSDAGGAYGSGITPASADEAITVTNSGHSEVVTLFSNMLIGVGNPDVSNQFTLSRLQSHSPGPWLANQYNKAGSQTTSGSFEAVITSESGGVVAQSINYVPLLSPPSVTVNSPNGSENWEVGSTQEIAWTATDDQAVTSIDISYSTTGPGGPFVTIANGEANDGNYMWTVPDTATQNAYVRVVAYDLAGNPSTDESDGPFTISQAASQVRDYAVSDQSITGSSPGSYDQTFASDGISQEITEESYANRRSRLEHEWTFNVTGGNSVGFYLRGYHDSSDGDDFVVRYSTDGVNYVDLVDLDSVEQSYFVDLPGSISGQVHVRVIDTNRGRSNNSSLDTVYIDEMYFESVTGPVVPVTDIEVTSVSAPSPVALDDLVQVDVTVQNIGNQDVDSDIVVVLTTDNATNDSVEIGTQIVPGGLAAGLSTVLTFTWDTASAMLGNHTLTATHSTADDNASNDSNTVEVVVQDTPVPVDVVIDDGEPGFEALGWSTKSSAQAYNGDYRYARAGSGSLVASWTLEGLAEGTYGVYATWVTHPKKHATNATYKVYDSTAQQTPEFTAQVSHRIAPNDNGWQLLGAITGTAVIVTLDNLADGTVVADAIRIVSIPSPGDSLSEVPSLSTSSSDLPSITGSSVSSDTRLEQELSAQPDEALSGETVEPGSSQDSYYGLSLMQIRGYDESRIETLDSVLEELAEDLLMSEVISGLALE